MSNVCFTQPVGSTCTQHLLPLISQSLPLQFPITQALDVTLTETWDTPNKISSHAPYALFIFIHCFLLFRNHKQILDKQILLWYQNHRLLIQQLFYYVVRNPQASQLEKHQNILSVIATKRGVKPFLRIASKSKEICPCVIFSKTLSKFGKSFL